MAPTREYAVEGEAVFPASLLRIEGAPSVGVVDIRACRDFDGRDGAAMRRGAGVEEELVGTCTGCT